MDPSPRATRSVARAAGLALAILVLAAVRASALDPATALVLEDSVLLAPAGVARPVAVAAGRLGRLFVADAGRGSVLALRPDGAVRFEFEKPAGQPALAPLDIALTGFQVYVLDATTRAVLRYSDQGSFLDVLASFQDRGGEPPATLDVDGTGRILLAEPLRHRVQLLDARGQEEALLGGFGSRLGELLRPRGVAFAADGAFWVSDTGNARLQRFTGVGNFDRAAADSLGEPRGLAVASTGELLVADPRRRSLQLRSARGALLDEVGLAPHAPLDVAVVGDTVWVLVPGPPALFRARLRRGD